MKTEYLFKPNLHWNYIPENIYKELLNFYDGTMLTVKVTEE